MSGQPPGDPVAVEARIVAHLSYARAVASRAIDPRCRGADREDLIAWGVVGLVQAARRYREGDLRHLRRPARARADPRCAPRA